MPYYRGDYYRGDNYRGDFLGIGKALKKVAGAAFNILAPAPLKAAVNLFAHPAPQVPGFAPGGMPMIGAPMLNIGVPAGGKPEPGIAGAAHRFFPGGHTGYGYYNKKGEFVEGKRPRMNPLNQRALSRAGRRVKGFLRIARRLGALPINRGKGKKLFKTKRR